MGFKLLRLIMIFGEILALTPSRNRVKKVQTKIYAGLVLTVLLTSSMVSVFYYRKPLYINFSEIKLVLTISMVILVSLFNCYTVLAPVFCKSHQYRFLVWVLEQDDHHRNKIPYVKFIVPNLIYWVINIYVAYVWTDILGFEYYKQYGVEVVQLYLQFYYNFFLCVVIRKLWGKYRHVNFLLTEQILYIQTSVQTERFPAALRRIQDMLYFLKEINVAFNDFFGWPILFTVLYSSTLVLNYLDDIFRNSFGYSKSQYIGVIVSNISVVLLTNIETLWFILLCDAVLGEAKRTVLLGYKLRQHVWGYEKEEVCQFITLVVDNFPEFTAAGFFSISKATVLHIMGTVTTFFIIIIQFNTSST